jgi:hypothetical protein
VLHALLMDALWRAIGDPHAHGGEGCRQRPFGSSTPVDASPLRGGENVFSRRGELLQECRDRKGSRRGRMMGVRC